VTTIPFDSHFYQFALESFCYHNGTPKPKDAYTIHVNDFGFSGRTYVLENNTTKNLHISFDLTRSTNILTSVNDLKGSLILNPREKRLLYHISAKDNVAWTYNSSFSSHS
jgi:hypothetical protein